MLISGYSFSDAHLNELIFDAATGRERSEFIAFVYSNIPDTLAERAEITPNLQVIGTREAIIGGIRSNWKEPEHELADVWSEGQFLLPDFKFLTRHLARSTQHRYEGDSNLRALLKEAMRDEGDEGQEDGHAG